MKLTIIISIFVLVLAVLLAKFINYSTSLASSEKQALRSAINSKILADYSVRNAVKINNSFSCKNSPVRPPHESFHDGILKEVKKPHDPELPECNLMVIRSFIIDNFAEDSNGTL